MSAPTACCWNDDEPLVSTFKYPGEEWICVVCRQTYAYFDPKPLDDTPELQARYEELKAQWDERQKEMSK